MRLKRGFDLALAILLFPFALPLMLIIAGAIRLTSTGPALFWSERIGRHNVNFSMAKFRSMRVDTPQLATHLMAGRAEDHLTPLGRFLRKTSLDELPQLWNIFKGEMSFVGPRPALFNQDDLRELRTAAGIHELTPGVTGWAQINGRDEIPIPQKVELEIAYLQNRSFAFDLKIIWLTFIHALRGADVSH